MLQDRLESPAGIELCAGKMKVDTLLVVARDDARTADARSGRGVSTSHETVAKRVGMSSRHVRTARRIIEKLGMAVTIVLGRHLSPLSVPMPALLTVATRRLQHLSAHSPCRLPPAQSLTEPFTPWFPMTSTNRHLWILSTYRVAVT